MRVALYSGTFQKDQDGVARTMYRLVGSMVDAGIDLTVWAPSITEGVDKGFKLYKIPSLSLPLYRDYRISIPRGIRKQLDEFKPDIIHITTADLVGRFFLQYGKKHNIPVVTSYHTDFPSYLKYYHLGFLKGALWSYFRWFHNGCKATFAPTRKVKEELESRGINSVSVWSRGIDTSQFNPERRSKQLRSKWGMENKMVILYSGRFVWYKDIDIFVEVYREIKKRYGDKVGFVLAGNGPREADLKKSMPDAVFPGYLFGEKFWEVYASSDIFLFPSVTETFGNVVFEAIASGTPAVVSDIGGCREIIEDTGGGFVARAKDTTSFSDNISKLLDDKDLYERIRSSGLKSASERGWDDVNGKVLDVYRKLIGSK